MAQLVQVSQGARFIDLQVKKSTKHQVNIKMFDVLEAENYFSANLQVKRHLDLNLGYIWCPIY